MRRGVLVAGLVAAVTALVASAAFAVTTLGERTGQPGYGYGYGSGNGYANGPGSMMDDSGVTRPGTGMGGMGRVGDFGGMRAGGMGALWLAGDGHAVTSIAAARSRAAQAAASLGLHPGEVMWFDNGFYVELKDASGASATEVLVGPSDGAVSIEPGPAMMWNTRYGMHAVDQTPASVSSGQAQAIATAWLRQHQAGTTVKSIDAYPGYYTLDLQRQGAVSGMMSVNASTGAVWYHTWHGRFIAMEDA